MSKGTADIVGEIKADLRGHGPLLAYLRGDPDAIYESHPAEETDMPIAVILLVVSDTTSPGRGVHEKSWRIQVTVKASRPWREAQSSGGVRAMQMVMDRVHERLDRLDALREVAHGSSGGANPEEMEGQYLAIANDWRLTGFYSDDRRPSQT